MTTPSAKSLNFFCIVGYILFMAIAFDSSVVDAVVFYVSDQNGEVVLKTGKVHVKPVSNQNGATSKALALQFQTDSKASTEISNTVKPLMAPVTPSTASAGEDIPAGHSSGIETPNETASFTAPPPDEKAGTSDDDEDDTGYEDDKADEATSQASGTLAPDGHAESARHAPPASGENPGAVSGMSVKKLSDAHEGGNAERIIDKVGHPEIAQEASSRLQPEESAPTTISIVSLIKALPNRRWEYDPNLDRYIVRYDANTILVLTLKPMLQKMVEKTFESYRCKIGAAVIQDPSTGAILALTSFDGHKAMTPLDSGFSTQNWALKATFPVASLFKIITASAGIEKRKVVPASTVRFGRKAQMQLWQAFAKSHNGVFGIVGRAVGQRVLQWYANAFGFNKPFYFDLPVSSSVAELPENSLKLGQAAAGLDKHFEVSPMHVSSIVSTILNQGRWMKPYLVDSVIFKGKVVFRRKPFQLAQPIVPYVAQQIYEMMRTTTTHGTGRRGFGAFADCPTLASFCGGKTGTLTGMDPAILFTWFGGFIRIADKDLGIVTLVGQGSGIKATTVAGRISHELIAGRTTPNQIFTQK